MQTALHDAPDKGAGSALFLLRLKNATADQHAMLETNELLSALLSPLVTARQYGSYLFLMHDIELMYEKEVLPKLELLIDGNRQHGSQLTTDDLESIGYVLPHNRSFRKYVLPRKEMNTAVALGFMYVMEGSKLGGKVIYKNINRVLHFSKEKGAKFLANYGADTGKEWKDFLAVFANFVTDNQQEEEAIKGAMEAFTSIYNFFEANRSFYAD